MFNVAFTFFVEGRVAKINLNIELFIVEEYLYQVKLIKSYLILCLLFVMPIQSIAASFQLACQDNHKTSMASEKKMSHCHENKAKDNPQTKSNLDYKDSHHCLSFCAQVGMSALTQDTDYVFKQDSIVIYSQYLYHYDSVTLPHIQRPPISFS